MNEIEPNEIGHLSPEQKRQLLARLLEEEVGAPGFFPLSFEQERLWFLDQLTSQTASYSISRNHRVLGRLDIPALERSFNEIARRHATLRTSFRMVGGQPMQVVAQRVTLPLPVTDLRGLPPAERPAAVTRHVDDEARRVFDLTEAPLLRVTLLRLDDETHELLLTMHHMAFDGWSIGVLYRELGTLYEAFANSRPSPLPDLAIQYPDFAVWQRERLRGALFDDHRAFWRAELAGAPPILELPTDRPRPPVQSFAGAWHHLELPRDLIEELTAFSHRQGVTLFMTLFAAFGLLIERHTGRDDLVIGTPFANRGHADTEDLIGFFVNNLVLRADLSGDPTMSELLARVRRTALGAYAHQEFPFAKLVEAVQGERDPGRNPLFQIMFSHEVTQPLTLADLVVSPTEADFVTSAVDLTLTMTETPRGFGAFIYNIALFDEATIARMARHYHRLLRQLIADPERKMSGFTMLSDAERHQILDGWNDTAVDTASAGLVHHMFEAQARAHPRATAVESETTQFTFTALNERANQLAHYLGGVGVGPETVVGVHLTRSVEMLIGILAILKTGAAYLPLEPTYPPERLRYMLTDAGAELVLTDARDGAALASPGVRLVHLDDPFDQFPRDNPVSDVTRQNIAYLIYTSGSTGRPKGVMISHGAVTNLFLAMDPVLGRDDRGTWLGVTGMSFDISVPELLWTVARGFRLLLLADPLEALVAVPRDAAARRPIDFSLFYFADDDIGATGPEKYRLLIEGARFADERGFAAIWTPERHAHSFGGLYPNPSLTSAAIAMVTRQIKIRAGSVVLPLHHPIRVAEEWAMVDNLSNGRVGISFASGWQINDFVLAPGNYADRKEIMVRDIDVVRRLWRGESVRQRDAAGNEMEISIQPRPLQAELPFWITSGGSPDTFRAAGEIGANVLTHLLGQSLDELAEKIRIYREARAHHGHPGDGHVTLMLHVFLGDDRDLVLRQVERPFAQYLRRSFDLLSARGPLPGHGADPRDLSEEEREAMLAHGLERYLGDSGLFGTPRDAIEMVGRLRERGVDEVSCLVDFGLGFEAIMGGLERLDAVREEVTRRARAPFADRFDLAAVTHMQCTPSLARMIMASSPGFAALPNLRKLLLGGEALPAPLLTEIAASTSAEIWNMYGPTETTVWSSANRLVHPTETGTVPIGAGIANTRLYVLDRRRRTAAIGVAGELFIGGAGLARGYWRKPALTAERFLPDPFSDVPGARMYRTGDLVRWRIDGTMEFLGRTDHQVKISGNRIELAEIEQVLRDHPAVRDAVVMAHGAAGEQRLVAYVVPRDRAVGETRLKPARLVSEFAGLEPRVLPNGMPILHHNASQSSAAYREVFEDRCYFQHGIALPDDACVIDAGANIGMFTLFVHQECANPTIYALEPIPPNFALLRANVALYGMRNVTLINSGLSDREETAEFTFYPRMAGMSTRSVYATGAKEVGRALIAARLGDRDEDVDVFLSERYQSETFSCPLTTVSHVIERYGLDRIDLLKVDVEGSESLVLAGIAERHWAKIDQLVLEVHSRALLDEVSSLLERKGYALNADPLATHLGDGLDDGEVFVAHLYARRNGQERATAVAVGTAPLTDALPSFLRVRLPAHMVPMDIVPLERLPLTPNGKLDRGALPAPGPRQPPARGPAVPETPIEGEIAAIWRRVLRQEQADIHTNFFDLGGTSLRMIEVLVSLRTAFPANAPSLIDLFRYPTIRSLASHLTSPGASPGADQDVRATAGPERHRRPRELIDRRQLLRAHRDRTQAERIKDRE